jgi:2-polyprenyl-3-methyl-5-hydroxy-6-metoxy-1,4-benzoquinol methylase
MVLLLAFGINKINMENYTDLQFWSNYWDGVDITPTKDVFYKNLITDIPQRGRVAEIGGFPGKLSTYFITNKNCELTIVDFFIKEEIIRKVEAVNNLQDNSIKFIKGDFVNDAFTETFDVVCSFGFLEHFTNTEEIIEKHLSLLRPNGHLLITIPNFRGINGLVQWLFDRENLKKHNLKAMNTKKLKYILSEQKVKSYEIGYFGGAHVWVEKGTETKFIKIVIKLLNKLLRFMPLKNNIVFATHIYIKASK